jgi:UPF0176 protein
MKLHNMVNREVLIERMLESTERRTTISFYKYAKIRNPQLFRDYLYANWEPLGVLGRVYVATEGINAQISLPSANIEFFKRMMNDISFFVGMRLNYAVDDDGKSFFKLAIKVRHKILADGLNDETFDVTKSGVHLNAEDFNRVISNPEAIIIDMRNHYESEIGHMENAITPDVDSFRDSLPVIADMIAGQKDKPLVMYCTGGIRCEKASAWFKHLGHKEVYQLNGGIIEYVRQCRDKGIPIKFKGKNFVFDERMAERISDDVLSVCHQCGEPADEHINCANLACNLLFIQCSKCHTAMEGCCSDDCRDIVRLPEDVQKELRKGRVNEKRFFAKGRSPKLKFKPVPLNDTTSGAD